MRSAIAMAKKRALFGLLVAALFTLELTMGYYVLIEKRELDWLAFAAGVAMAIILARSIKRLAKEGT